MLGSNKAELVKEIIRDALKLEEKLRVCMIENELDVDQECVGQDGVENRMLWGSIMKDCYIQDKIRIQEKGRFFFQGLLLIHYH